MCCTKVPHPYTWYCTTCTSTATLLLLYRGVFAPRRDAGSLYFLLLLHLERPPFDEDLIRGRMPRVHPSSVVIENLYCLSVLLYYYVHTNVSDLYSGRNIYDITPPILMSIPHVFIVPKVAVGKERRTRVGQTGFLNRQHPLLELL